MVGCFEKRSIIGLKLVVWARQTSPRDAITSASPELGLQLCTTTYSFCLFFFWRGEGVPVSNLGHRAFETTTLMVEL